MNVSRAKFISTNDPGSSQVVKRNKNYKINQSKYSLGRTRYEVRSTEEIEGSTKTHAWST
jgi:hypothetical protein